MKNHPLKNLDIDRTEEFEKAFEEELVRLDEALKSWTDALDDMERLTELDYRLVINT